MGYTGLLFWVTTRQTRVHWQRVGYWFTLGGLLVVHSLAFVCILRAYPIESNFPMALDESDNRLLVATRVPPQLVVFDTTSGRLVAALPSVQDSDDLYYDSARKRVYVSGGEGYISVFQQRDPDHYSLLAKVQSGLGGRTSGYFGKGRKGFDRYYVVVPTRAGHDAEVLIYTLQD